MARAAAKDARYIVNDIGYAVDSQVPSMLEAGNCRQPLATSASQNMCRKQAGTS
jgi:hypothetical protein